MIRRTLTTVVAACSVLLLVGACGAPASGGSSDEPVGDPVSGGSATMIQIREPVSLDPATLSNNWVGQSLLGNALFGTLMIDNPETLEIEYQMATDFSTADGGNTFTLELQPGLTFTDGTPLDAEAVHLNWSRIADPDMGSSSLPQASQISATEVVDDTTLKVVMANPNPMFAYSITNSTLNWIASPAALEKGRDASTTPRSAQARSLSPSGADRTAWSSRATPTTGMHPGRTSTASPSSMSPTEASG